jgi:membrane associated rhomboid family serine protease
MFEKEKKLVMCQACRALVDPADKVCPMCGNQSVPARRVGEMTGGHFISLLVLSVNIILFILMGIVGVRNGGGAQAFFASPSGAVLYDFGGFNTALFKAGEWWRMITCNFLHIGLMHLLFNSFALIQLGPLVEEFYGSQKFVFLYLTTGIVSSLASYGFAINGAGASGAIFGLLGILAVYGYRQGGVWGRSLMRQVLIWAAIGIVMGFMIRANNVAHIGGFIGGAILGFVLKGEAPQTVRAASVWNVVALLSVALIVVSFVFVAKHYGDIQEQVRQDDIKRSRMNQGAENIVTLSQLMRQANQTLQQLAGKPVENDLRRAAASLKELATSINRLPTIDEKSDAIRKQYVALLNRRADKIEAAQKPTPFSLSATEILEQKQLFEDYLSWEKSIINDYGLEYTNPEDSK